MSEFPSKNLEKANVVISHEMKEGRSLFEVRFLPDERRISIQECAHILVGGLGVIIRASSQGDSITEHELMKQVVEHLTKEFISPDSFKDAMLNKDILY